MSDGDDYRRLGLVLHGLHLGFVANSAVCTVGVNLVRLFSPKLRPLCDLCVNRVTRQAPILAKVTG